MACGKSGVAMNDGNKERFIMKRTFRFELADYLMLLILLAAMALLVFSECGCASATPQYDSAGNIVGVTGYGFLRDLEIKQVKADGSSFELKSKSTSADIMKVGNEMLGTITATASKPMP